MPNEIRTRRASNVEYIENPQNAVASTRRTYDENTLEERVELILEENPRKAEVAIQDQQAFMVLCQRVFRGRAGRWPTSQIQVELSRQLAGPATLNGFR